MLARKTLGNISFFRQMEVGIHIFLCQCYSRNARPCPSVVCYWFLNVSALLFPDINFCGYLLRPNFSEHKVISLHKWQMLFTSNVLIRNSLRIVQIWETSKKHGRGNICSIENKISIFKNSLFTGSEQNTSCSETCSDHCQISKIGCFEKVVDGFELLTIFGKRSILVVWQGSEYGSAADNYSSLGKKLMSLQELSRLFKDRNIKLSSYCLH